MSLFDELKNLGVNVDEGMGRLMGNASLYEKMLGKFAKMIRDSSVKSEDFDCEDCTELIEKTHAIKGASGNLSVTPVYAAYTEIVDLLRSNQPEQAKIVFDKNLSVQDDIIACIENHMQ
ncbi:MAG: hypothetical protein HDT39_01555 [Lachnospiraceae bacterium]|nr:hypothetical protein [Lachnospiraceae bacterium]